MVSDESNAVFPSPVGVLRATFSNEGLVSLELSGQGEPLIRGAGVLADRLACELAAYFAGASEPFKTPLDLSAGTPFQQRVWRELRRVPFGKTVSYAELARRVGAPGAARAVGQAAGANPVLIIVPCHRVVRSDGALGGFSAGLDIKRWLLRHEGCL